MLCRVRVPRILIVLKGSQHGTHEGYYLIDQGMGSSARALESTLGHTLAPSRSAAPAISGLGELDCCLATIGQKGEAPTRLFGRLFGRCGHRKRLRLRLRAPRLEPRTLVQLAVVVRLPNADRLAREPGGLGRPEATASRMLLLGTARARELSASSYRCSAAAVHTGTTSGPPRMWRRGARSRAVPSPAHGRQSHDVAVQEHEDEHRCGIV